jgi:hypothetical protein
VKGPKGKAGWLAVGRAKSVKCAVADAGCAASSVVPSVINQFRTAKSHRSQITRHAPHTIHTNKGPAQGRTRVGSGQQTNSDAIVTSTGRQIDVERTFLTFSHVKIWVEGCRYHMQQYENAEKFEKMTSKEPASTRRNFPAKM